MASAKTYADTAESDAIVTAGSYTDTREVSILSVLRGELSAVAGTDITEQLGTFVSRSSFTIANPVSLANNDILVFVNGLQIHRSADLEAEGFATDDGATFNLRHLGYEIDANDHVVVVGVAA